MKYKLTFLLVIFTGLLASYEWINLMNEESNTNHVFNSLANGNIYYSTNQGVKVFSEDTSNLYTYAGLGAIGIAETWAERYLALGSGSYSDGLYTIDDSGNIDLVDWYYNPKFLDTGKHSNDIYFSSQSNFLINQNNEWTRPAEFFYKEVHDITESSCYRFATTNDGFYHKLASQTGLFANRQNFGNVQSNEINEASGLVASCYNPGVLWTHNDSGGGNFIFAMNELGHHLGIYTLSGATNRDWEDMAIGKNPNSGQAEIYLADIGDNQLSNDIKYIYIASEPQVSPTQNPQAITLDSINTIPFIYPNGQNYDAETLLYDQRSQTFYIITKRHPNDSETYDQIFSVTYTISETPQVASYVGQVSFPVDELVYQGATGGDISPDGNFILIKNYQNIYMWERRNMSIGQALSQPFIQVPYIMEPQGEAIAWRYDNNGYFTVSEEYSNIPAVVYFYSKLGWRKASPLPFKKSEYNNSDGNLYAIINDNDLYNGFWKSSDDGLNWQRINNYPSYSDIAVDALGLVFLSHMPSLIPEDWQRVSGYYQGEFLDLSSGLENKFVNRLVNNTILDSPSVLACTNAGVYYLQNYQSLSNQANNVVPLPEIQSYPNPFNDKVTLSLSKSGLISGKIYNLKGQLVADLTKDIKKGSEQVIWQPDNSIPNGIYIIKFSSSQANFTGKILKLK
jgi:hypothetical protein